MSTQPLDELPYRPCVGIVLLNSSGLIFAGRRIDTRGGAHEAWQMPQGGIDEGEGPREAAFRELEEETGVTNAQIIAESSEWMTYDLPPELLGKIWNGKYRGQKQKWYAMVFTGQDADINIATEHPEFEEWRWMPGADILKHIVEFKRDVYEHVLDGFSDHWK